MPRKTDTPAAPRKPAARKATTPQADTAPPPAETAPKKPRRRASPASPVGSPTTLAAALTEADIAAEAYLLWLADGQPHGKDLEHWVRAEQIVRGRQPVAP